MLTDLFALVFVAGIAVGVFVMGVVAVLAKRREEPERESDPTLEADWWKRGESPPEYEP